MPVDLCVDLARIDRQIRTRTFDLLTESVR